MNMAGWLPWLRLTVKAIVFGLAAAFVVMLFRPEWAQQLRSGPVTQPRIPAQSSGAPRLSYADAVERAAPSVVSIYTARVITVAPVLPNSTFQRFSGMTLGQPRSRLERALGSGVIVSKDGYVLTNHHVISNADEIQVVLWDGRVTQARIIGSDPDTELAVLKVEGSDLPAMSLESGASSRVGDVVLAIGNPFGLSQTVTQGIVSALGRNQLNRSTYEDFIQTDAAINEGNSGGALINAEGDLIGINTFVLGRMAGAEGIGFAIPVETARVVLKEIVEKGMVVRGWIGAEYGDAPILPGGLAPGTTRGVALTYIYPGGPADTAGLRSGDVLTRFNGADLADRLDLREREAALTPGSRVEIEGFRAGLPIRGELVLIQRPLARSG